MIKIKTVRKKKKTDLELIHEAWVKEKRKDFYVHILTQKIYCTVRHILIKS